MPYEHDVRFGAAGGVDLKLDIYRPDGASKRAAILFYHGGSWRGGSKDGMRDIAAAMAGHGFVGLPAQYRLVGQSPYPAQINDVKTAIRWTRAHADELGIDPDRIILWGSSAGAHLALLAGGTQNDPRFDGPDEYKGASSSIAAVIAVHPATGFYLGQRTARLTTPANNLLGDEHTAEEALAASPITYANKAFPPTLLLHGTQDKRVHHAASQAMHDALREVHAIVDLHLFHGHNHGFAGIPSVRDLVAAEANYFLDRVLIDPAKYEAETLKYSMFARRAMEERAAANA